MGEDNKTVDIMASVNKARGRKRRPPYALYAAYAAALKFEADDVSKMDAEDVMQNISKLDKASEEYKQYDQAKAKLKENPELEKMIKDVQRKQFEIQTMLMMGQEVPQDQAASIQTLYAIILKDPVAAAYMEAEMRFSVMMKDVYEILGEVSGMGDILG